MYHSEAFYQYQLGGLLHTSPPTDFELLTNPIFTSRPKPPPAPPPLHLPLTVGDGPCCHGVCHTATELLNSRARDHIKPQNFSATPWDPCTYRPQVFWLSCIAIEVQVNMWNKCDRLSLCVDVQREGGFLEKEKGICSGKGETELVHLLNLRYIYTLYSYSFTLQREILYFLFHCICLTAAVTSDFAD